jgi:hypothetical protein
MKAGRSDRLIELFGAEHHGDGLQDVYEISPSYCHGEFCRTANSSQESAGTYWQNSAILEEHRLYHAH